MANDKLPNLDEVALPNLDEAALPNLDEVAIDPLPPEAYHLAAATQFRPSEEPMAAAPEGVRSLGALKEEVSALGKNILEEEIKPKWDLFTKVRETAYTPALPSALGTPSKRAAVIGEWIATYGITDEMSPEEKEEKRKVNSGKAVGLLFDVASLAVGGPLHNQIRKHIWEQGFENAGIKSVFGLGPLALTTATEGALYGGMYEGLVSYAEGRTAKEQLDRIAVGTGAGAAFGAGLAIGAKGVVGGAKKAFGFGEWATEKLRGSMYRSSTAKARAETVEKINQYAGRLLHENPDMTPDQAMKTALDDFASDTPPRIPLEGPVKPLPEPTLAFAAGNIKQIFNEKEAHQAITLKALAKHIGLDPEKIVLVEGGQPAVDALLQEARERAPIWYERSAQLVTEKISGPMKGKEIKKLMKKAGIKDEEMKWNNIESLDDSRKYEPYEIQAIMAERAWEVTVEKRGDGLGRMAQWDAYRLGQTVNEFPEGAAPADSYVELVVKLNPKVGTELQGVPLGTTTHWQDSRVVGHVRATIRRIQDPNDPTKAKKLLFLEEVQSDWSQEGKARGFEEFKGNKPRKVPEAEAESIRQMFHDSKGIDRETGNNAARWQEIRQNAGTGADFGRVFFRTKTPLPPALLEHFGLPPTETHSLPKFLRSRGIDEKSPMWMLMVDRDENLWQLVEEAGWDYRHNNAPSTAAGGGPIVFLNYALAHAGKQTPGIMDALKKTGKYFLNFQETGDGIGPEFLGKDAVDWMDDFFAKNNVNFTQEELQAFVEEVARRTAAFLDRTKEAVDSKYLSDELLVATIKRNLPETYESALMDMFMTKDPVGAIIDHADPFSNIQALTGVDPFLQNDYWKRIANMDRNAPEIRTWVERYVNHHVATKFREKFALGNFEDLKPIRDKRQTYMEAGPFVTDDKAVTELLIKVALQHAAEIGADEIAWTPGWVQQTLNRLSESFKEVTAVRKGDMVYFKGVSLRNRNLETEGIKIDAIHRYVPKNLVQQVLKMKDGQERVFRGSHLRFKIPGLALFYDNILSSAMERKLKQWGVKKGTTTFKIQPKLEKSENQYALGGQKRPDNVVKVGDTQLSDEEFFGSTGIEDFLDNAEEYGIDHALASSDYRDIRAEVRLQFQTWANENPGAHKNLIRNLMRNAPEIQKALGKLIEKFTPAADDPLKNQSSLVPMRIAKIQKLFEALSNRTDLAYWNPDRVRSAIERSNWLNERLMKPMDVYKEPLPYLWGELNELLLYNYERYMAKVGNPYAEVQRVLKDNGINVRFLTAEPLPQKTIVAPSYPITSQMRDDILYHGQSLFQPGKGAVEFTGDGIAIIRAFKNADFSTAIHELAHVARRNLFNREIPAMQRVGITNAMIEATERWAGVTDGVWTREAEEKFARGFERYLRENKAPNSKLRRVFKKISDWLTDIYGEVAGSDIDVELTPEIRGVFDRLMSGRVNRRVSGPPVSPMTMGRDYWSNPTEKEWLQLHKSMANLERKGTPPRAETIPPSRRLPAPEGEGPGPLKFKERATKIKYPGSEKLRPFVRATAGRIETFREKMNRYARNLGSVVESDPTYGIPSSKALNAWLHNARAGTKAAPVAAWEDLQEIVLDAIPEKWPQAQKTETLVMANDAYVLMDRIATIMSKMKLKGQQVRGVEGPPAVGAKPHQVGTYIGYKPLRERLEALLKNYERVDTPEGTNMEDWFEEGAILFQELMDREDWPVIETLMDRFRGFTDELHDWSVSMGILDKGQYRQWYLPHYNLTEIFKGLGNYFKGSQIGEELQHTLFRASAGEIYETNILEVMHAVASAIRTFEAERSLIAKILAAPEWNVTSRYKPGMNIRQGHVLWIPPKGVANSVFPDTDVLLSFAEQGMVPGEAVFRGVGYVLRKDVADALHNFKMSSSIDVDRAMMKYTGKYLRMLTTYNPGNFGVNLVSDFLTAMFHHPDKLDPLMVIKTYPKAIWTTVQGEFLGGNRTYSLAARGGVTSAAYAAQWQNIAVPHHILQLLRQGDNPNVFRQAADAMLSNIVRARGVAETVPRIATGQAAAERAATAGGTPAEIREAFLKMGRESTLPYGVGDPKISRTPVGKLLWPFWRYQGMATKRIFDRLGSKDTRRATIAALLAPSIGAFLWNNMDEEGRHLEAALNDYDSNSLHFYLRDENFRIIRHPDGTPMIWSMRYWLPEEVLRVVGLGNLATRAVRVGTGIDTPKQFLETSVKEAGKNIAALPVAPLAAAAMIGEGWQPEWLKKTEQEFGDRMERALPLLYQVGKYKKDVESEKYTAVSALPAAFGRMVGIRRAGNVGGIPTWYYEVYELFKEARKPPSKRDMIMGRVEPWKEAQKKYAEKIQALAKSVEERRKFEEWAANMEKQVLWK